jgi:hypothetical protein
MSPTVTCFRLRRLLLIFAAAALSSTPVDGRPLFSGSTGRNEPDLAPLSIVGALDTVWFGGTVWDGDSLRWEAIPGGTWTFESGVGSAIAGPGDPDKHPGLHRLMEGWKTENPWTANSQFFRRLSVTDFTGESPCVGAPAGLGGSASLWAGVRLADFGDDLCYAGGSGYGNNWDIAIGRTLTYPGSGTVTLAYDYRVDTEAAFDYVYVEVDRDAGGPAAPVTVATYDGSQAGTASILLSQANGALPVAAGDIVISFRVVSDGSYSDEDGLEPSDCGAVALDDISLTGAISAQFDFEAGSDGWVALAGPGSTRRLWTDLRDLDDLPETSPPACGIQDSVLVFYNYATEMIDVLTTPLVVSPWIDLKAVNVTGASDVLIQFDIFQDFVRPDHVGYAYYIQKYPVTCAATGQPTTSGFGNITACYFFPDPCRFVIGCPGDPVTHSLGSLPESIERIRVAVAATNDCWAFDDCPGPNNDTTPYIDNIRVGVSVPAGVSDAGDGIRPGAGLRVLGPQPIVGADRTRFELAGRVGSAAKLEILNVAGAIVRTVYQGRLTAASVTIEWDMRSEAGGRVPGGIYFARLTGDETAVRKLVVVH